MEDRKGERKGRRIKRRKKEKEEKREGGREEGKKKVIRLARKSKNLGDFLTWSANIRRAL